MFGPPEGTRSRSDVRTPLLARESSDLEAGEAKSPGVLRLLAEARLEAGTLVLATVFLLIGALANLAVPKVSDRTLLALAAAVLEHCCCGLHAQDLLQYMAHMFGRQPGSFAMTNCHSCILEV